jgi:acylphosphatase
MRSHIDIKISGLNPKIITNRFELYKEARLRNICGSIRYHDPGTIMVSAEGEKEKLDEFGEWCRDNLSHDETGIVIESSDRLMNYNDFIISE